MHLRSKKHTIPKSPALLNQGHAPVVCIFNHRYFDERFVDPVVRLFIVRIGCPVPISRLNLVIPLAKAGQGDLKLWNKIDAKSRHFLALSLEHIPKKLLDFFDEDMLQLFKFERSLFDHMIPGDREAL
jgi:hypothetical protein